MTVSETMCQRMGPSVNSPAAKGEALKLDAGEMSSFRILIPEFNVVPMAKDLTTLESDRVL